MRDISATIVAALAGVAVSMTSGFLVASYVTSGVTAGYETSGRIATVRPSGPVFIDDHWSPPAYDRIQIGFPDSVSDQPGVRASGSSRL